MDCLHHEVGHQQHFVVADWECHAARPAENARNRGASATASKPRSWGRPRLRTPASGCFSLLRVFRGWRSLQVIEAILADLRHRAVCACPGLAWPGGNVGVAQAPARDFYFAGSVRSYVWDGVVHVGSPVGSASIPAGALASEPSGENDAVTCGQTRRRANVQRVSMVDGSRVRSSRTTRRTVEHIC